MSQKKKKFIMRIIVIVLALLMFAGVAFGSVAYIFAEEAVVVESFEKGSFSDAFGKAKGETDQNNVKSLIVKNGEFSVSDLSALQNLSSCKVIDLGGTTIEGAKLPDGIMSGRTVSKFVLPSNVTALGNSAFSGCGSLEEIIFPSSLTSIGNRTFESCSSLKTITIPAGVTAIDECAFRGSGLENIVFEGNAPSLSSESIPTSAAVVISKGAKGFDTDAWSAYTIVETEAPVAVTTKADSSVVAAEESNSEETATTTTTSETTAQNEQSGETTSVKAQGTSGSTTKVSSVVIWVIAGAVVLIIIIIAAATAALKIVGAKDEQPEQEPEKMVERVEVEVVSEDVSKE